MSDYIVKVKYSNEIAKVHPIVKIKNGDWIDLYTAETVEMYPGDYKRISLGVSIKLP